MAYDYPLYDDALTDLLDLDLPEETPGPPGLVHGGFVPLHHHHDMYHFHHLHPPRVRVSNRCILIVSSDAVIPFPSSCDGALPDRVCWTEQMILARQVALEHGFCRSAAIWLWKGNDLDSWCSSMKCFLCSALISRLHLLWLRHRGSTLFRGRRKEFSWKLPQVFYYFFNSMTLVVCKKIVYRYWDYHVLALLIPFSDTQYIPSDAAHVLLLLPSWSAALNDRIPSTARDVMTSELFRLFALFIRYKFKI